MLQYTTQIAEQVDKAVQYFHENPEPSLHEYNTTAYIKKVMEEIGVQTLELGMETGYIGILNGGKPGITVALRGDMDGIAQEENPSHRVKSQKEGLMHACGHDVHMGAMLGAAMMLANMKNELKGNVVFIFQPGEEILKGAHMVIDAGLFEKVQIRAMFGLHNQPSIPAGIGGIKDGILMSAKDDFLVTVKGVGGHGGAPHMTVDPIVAAAAMVNALQTIVSRNVDPFESAVVSMGSIHAGTGDNLVVGQAVMTGSIRTLSKEVRQMVLERFETIVDSTARAYGCIAEIHVEQVVPALVNSESMTCLAREAASRALGEENTVAAKRTLCSEDFALYANYTDTFFYFLGSGKSGEKNAAWHDGDFFADPKTASYGARLLAESALCAMHRLNDPQT